MKLVRPQKISDQVLSVLEGRIVEGVYAEGGQDSARTRFGGRVRRFASVGPVGIEYFGCPSDFGSEAGRWLLCFGQAAAGFFAKLAGAFGQTFQLGTGCF